MNNFYAGKEILITGGAGTLGKVITKTLIKQHPEINGIRIYSRDEEKHRAFKEELDSSFNAVPVSFLIGDIRDLGRLSRAMNGVDFVIHTAAMKQIPHCEMNPIEAVGTNVTGTCNVIDACINNIVQKAILISTDKACYPTNLYGATKATAEKLFLHANVYSPRATMFSICRYGNVFDSRGSVTKVWQKEYRSNKQISITDEDMTRFWIRIEKVAQFVIDRLEEAKGGEIFIPDMKSFGIIQMAKAFLPPDFITKKIGIRKGEKLHECLITKEESLYTKLLKDYYEIKFDKQKAACPFTYTSQHAEKFYSEEFVKEMKGE